VPVVFAPVLPVAVSPRSRLCPPGWAGLVVIANAAIATAPDPRAAHIIERALSVVPAASVTDAELLHRSLAIGDMLGPATLAYLHPADFRPPDAPAMVEPLDARDPMLREFWSQADAAELPSSSTPPVAGRREGRRHSSSRTYVAAMAWEQSGSIWSPMTRGWLGSVTGCVGMAAGHGAATIAVRLASAWAFEELSTERLNLITAPENAASQRVA